MMPKLADPVAQINILAIKNISRGHALHQGTTNAKLPVQRLFQKALIQGPLQCIRAACKEPHLTVDQQVLFASSCMQIVSLFFCFCFIILCYYTRIWRDFYIFQDVFNKCLFIITFEAYILVNSVLCNVPCYY